MELELPVAPVRRIASESEPPNLATEMDATSGPLSARNPPSPVPIRLCPSPRTPRKRGVFWDAHWLLASVLSLLRGKHGEIGRIRGFASRQMVDVRLHSGSSAAIFLRPRTGNLRATSRDPLPGQSPDPATSSWPGACCKSSSTSWVALPTRATTCSRPRVSAFPPNAPLGEDRPGAPAPSHPRDAGALRRPGRRGNQMPAG